jgi:hypothetical protein
LWCAQDHHIEAGQILLMGSKTLTDNPLQPVPIRRSFDCLFSDRESQPWGRVNLFFCQDREKAVRITFVFREYPFEINRMK